MSQPDLFVGIDVAKDELVIHLHPAGMLWRVANSKTGLAMLGRKLTRLAGTACLRIGFERRAVTSVSLLSCSIGWRLPPIF